jgi:cysteine desulfurase/selenocysteine lyase
MTISNTEIEKIIYAEACHYYPELFNCYAAAPPHIESDIGGARLLPSVYGDAGTLPPVTAAASRLPPLQLCKPYPPYDVYKIRTDFPILDETANGRNLIWFDNAATTQKPRCVIERLVRFYERENSNVHRAAHTLARRTTDAYEDARRKIAGFINAPGPETIVFVRGATEGINLVASSCVLPNISEGDEILLTEMEHHANIVPWHLLCGKTGAKLKFTPVDDGGQIRPDEFRRLLTRRTKIVAFSHVSNVLGTIAPAEEMIRLAHNAGVKVLVDGAQAVSHLPVDVTALDADFYVFSGHKLFGPTGIGVLYGKTELLCEMPPYQGGGSMISGVTTEESRFREPPYRFEAGTGNIAGAIGLGCAVDYVSRIGLETVRRYEQDLTAYTAELFNRLPGLSVIGSGALKAGIVSFFDKEIDSDVLAALLDREGIAVRSGHHCAQPVLKRFGLDRVVRVSFALYNTFEEIDTLISVLSLIKSQY